MASELDVVCPLRSCFVSSQLLFVFAHSPSASDFFCLNSTSSFSKMSRIGCEWNLYEGSWGSTPCCKSADADHLGPSLMSFMASASARLFFTACVTATRLAGEGEGAEAPPRELLLELWMAWVASCRDAIALVRSAFEAWYSAASRAQRAVALARSTARDSCLARRSPSSASFPSFSEVFSSMVADRPVILSLPAVTLPASVAVLSLQKQEKVS
mmetsp:Transcript_93609/g.274168  ORF Transcript_93609/g.274168 Transcript_93609/m.274168 type:complete len:214 (+) Transcript_93609:1399-2040(+)